MHRWPAVRISEAAERVLSDDGQAAAFSRRRQLWAVQAGVHVMAIDPVHRVWLEAVPQEGEEIVAQQDVDGGGGEKRGARGAGPDVLADHLEQRKALAVLGGSMCLCRNCVSPGV